VADGTDSTAYFTLNITGNRTVTLDTARTIGNITFTDTTPSHNLTITAPNSLTLDVTSGSPIINVSQSGRTLTIYNSVAGSLIAGSDGYTKTGDGRLILNARNGTNYTYTGDTVVSGGILRFGTGYQNTWGAESLPAGVSNLEINNAIVEAW